MLHILKLALVNIVQESSDGILLYLSIHYQIDQISIGNFFLRGNSFQSASYFLCDFIADLARMHVLRC